jgi:enoyl-CoA hydratase/carnithine racemase
LSNIKLDLETIAFEQPTDQIAIATLNRPERYNSMTDTMFREFEELADAVNADDDVRVLILTGAGKAFCAGFDLDAADELPTMGALAFLEQQETAARGLLAIRSVRIPVIAAVNGAAAGGGFSLSLAADIRLASTAAKFNAAFVRIGLSAGDLGTSWLLPKLIGPARAAELAYTGRFMFAEESERTGLVNAVHEPDELLDKAIALAEQICTNSPGGVQLSKRALQANMEIGSFAAALELENRGQALLTRTSDMAEALAAFKQKRTPIFTGR